VDVFLLQLSDVTLGGATVFPLINAGTNPVKVNMSDINTVLCSLGLYTPLGASTITPIQFNKHVTESLRNKANVRIY